MGGGRTANANPFEDALQGAVQPAVDRSEILALRLQPLVPVLEDDEGDAGVGEARPVVEDGDAADRDHVLDAGDLAGDPLDLLQHPIGSLLRGAVGQLRGDDQIALVLVRQERGRHARQSPDRDADQNEREGDDEGAAVNEGADEPGVAAFERRRRRC